MIHSTELAVYRNLKRGIELGFFNGNPLIYDGNEPVAIDARAGKGKLTRFLGVNLVSPRTAHLSKIITDPKDGELAWVSWKTLEREGYRVRFINPGKLYGYPSESYNPNTRLMEIASNPALRSLVWEAAYDAASYLVPVDPNPAHKWIGQGVRTSFALYYKIAALHPSSERPHSRRPLGFLRTHTRGNCMGPYSMERKSRHGRGLGNVQDDREPDGFDRSMECIFLNGGRKAPRFSTRVCGQRCNGNQQL